MVQNSIILQNVSLSDIETMFSNLIDTKLQSFTQNKPEHDSDNLLTRLETAELLKISLPTLNDWTKVGVIKAKKIGTRVRYLRSDVEAALKDMPNLKYAHKN